MNEDEIIITFDKPIVVGKGEAAVTFHDVKLREPLAGELEKATRADTSIGSVITLVSLIGAIPRSAAEQMKKRDLVKANAFFEGFTDSGSLAVAAGQS